MLVSNFKPLVVSTVDRFRRKLNKAQSTISTFIDAGKGEATITLDGHLVELGA